MHKNEAFVIQLRVKVEKIIKIKDDRNSIKHIRRDLKKIDDWRRWMQD